MAPFDLAAADRLLTTTRAVRKRLDLDRPVEPDVLLECLRIAQQAPTGSNAQGWRWLVVTDQEKKNRLAELYRRAGEPYLRSAMDGDVDPQTRRVLSSAVYLADNLERVPVLVIPCLKGRLGSETPAVVWTSAMGSIFPAVWSFQLALRARGLGSCLTSFHLAFADEAAALLGIPDDVTQVALLPVAYTKGTDFSPARRGPVENIVHWDAWGAQRQS